MVRLRSISFHILHLIHYHMKKTLTIPALAILILIISMGVSDPDKSRLMTAVENVGRVCPIDLGFSFKLTGASYNPADEGAVKFDYTVNPNIMPIGLLRKNAQLAKQSTALSFSRDTQRQMLEMMIKAGASLTIKFANSDNPSDSFTSTLSNDELKKIYDTPVNRREAAKALLDIQLAIVNSSLPAPANAQGITLKGMTDNGKYVVYTYAIPGAKKQARQPSNQEIEQMKRAIRPLFDNPIMRQTLIMLTELDRGLKYIYKGVPSGSTVELTYSPQELKEYLQQ